jgi:hypothetical protein
LVCVGGMGGGIGWLIQILSLTESLMNKSVCTLTDGPF